MRKTTTIGFMVPDITNPVFPEVARGLEDAALAAGYTVFLATATGTRTVSFGLSIYCCSRGSAVWCIPVL